MIVTPGPVTGSRPAYARTRRRSARISSDRRLAAVLVRGERRELALEGRDLLAQLVVALVEVRDEDRQVLGDERREPGAAGLGAQLDDDEQAEHEGHGRDRQLVATDVHRGQPGGLEAGPAAGVGDGAATGRE